MSKYLSYYQERLSGYLNLHKYKMRLKIYKKILKLFKKNKNTIKL